MLMFIAYTARHVRPAYVISFKSTYNFPDACGFLQKAACLREELSVRRVAQIPGDLKLSQT